MVSFNTRNKVNLVHPPTKDEISKARLALDVYLKIYFEFMVGCVMKTPEPNDFGDLENMIYLAEGYKIITSDKKWLEIANNLGLGDAVQTLKN
jgi:hypothetical protein